MRLAKNSRKYELRWLTYKKLNEFEKYAEKKYKFVLVIFDSVPEYRGYAE
jgi:hypothetical protein